jgi:hypothetical protein
VKGAVEGRLACVTRSACAVCDRLGSV